MEKTLFNKNGLPTAYITDDYNQDIYLWDGHAVAYIFENEHVYGINGDHLGWFVQEIVFNNYGERVGFTSSTCPVTIAKELSSIRPARLRILFPSFCSVDSGSALPALAPTSGFVRFFAVQKADLLKQGYILYHK